MQSRNHKIQPAREMDMQSHQHLIQQLGKLPGKGSNILTVNAKGGIPALLQPTHTSSNTIEKIFILLSSNYNFLSGIFSIDCLLYDGFPAFKQWDSPLFEPPIFSVYSAGKNLKSKLWTSIMIALDSL